MKLQRLSEHLVEVLILVHYWNKWATFVLNYCGNKINRFESKIVNKKLRLKLFTKYVESQWTTEIRSLATKDRNEKSGRKTVQPLTKDVQKFRVHNELKNQKTLVEHRNNAKAYKKLVLAVLALTNLFNRRIIGMLNIWKLQNI